MPTILYLRIKNNKADKFTDFSCFSKCASKIIEFKNRWFCNDNKRIFENYFAS